MGKSIKRFGWFLVFFGIVAPVVAVPLAWVGAFISGDMLAEAWGRSYGYTSGVAFGWYFWARS